MKTSRLIAFILFGAVYVLGNIGGNYAGWDVILRWFEEVNGAATVAPIWFHPVVMFALAILPSIGQWWGQWFSIDEKWQRVVHAIMAADLAINTIGFYDLAMGDFSWPPVFPVFIFLAAVAAVPNIVCQGIATENLKVLLNGEGSRRSSGNSKTARPAPPPDSILPATFKRRSNGSVALEYEE